jgi:hypothetical protein
MCQLLSPTRSGKRQPNAIHLISSNFHNLKKLFPRVRVSFPVAVN